MKKGVVVAMNLRSLSLFLIGVLFISCSSSLSNRPLKRVEKSLSFKLEKEVVWAALTDKEKLGAWWGKNVRLEPHVGGDFYEPWGKDQLATGKVLSVKSNRRIKFTWREKTWRPSNKTICVFELKEKNGVTVLTVKHFGWESFKDLEERKKMREGFDKGWGFYLSKLKKYLESL